MDEIGYVAFTRTVDVKGKGMTRVPVATHEPFQRAVLAALQGVDFVPAIREGKAIDGAVWLAVIFNPKSSAPRGADAAPRLLTVAPVFTTEQPAARGMPPVVRMKLSLDASGAIVAAEPVGNASDGLVNTIREALNKWRFAPARRAGEPVAAEIVVPVLCQRPLPTQIANVKPARAKHQVPPIYPPAMRRYRIQGRVEFEFVVDVDGRVLNPVIVASENPAFDEPALTALRQWTFEPATRNGHPVKTKLRVPIVFQIAGGGEAFRIEQNGDQSKLPPELRYDTAPKIRGVLIPVYPYALRRDGVRGAAEAAMFIEPSGKVASVKILSADRPEFGRALAASLEGFTFFPALKDGRPVAHLLRFEQKFNAFELPDDAGERILSLEQKRPEKIVGAKELDAPLKPLSRRPPNFPTGLPAGLTAGEALIECVVDDDGRVRLPRIVSATDEAFGYAAAQAAAAWWFEPPTVGGKPTNVRVRLPFHFKAASPGPGPKAPAAATP